MPAPALDSQPQLCQIIAQRIAEHPQHRITFAEFMELALYHPQYGYYSTKQALGGIQDDFFTSPHLGADFGELLAKQFAQMWEQLDRPVPFTLVEMGAGQGLLVQDILRYLHRHQFECFEALEYIIIEKSTALIAEQQHRLHELTKSWHHLHWRTWEEIPSESIVGCFFSNELVDAFPVHQVISAAGELQEVYVMLGRSGVGKQGSGIRDQGAEIGGQEVEFLEGVAALSTPQIAAYFDQMNISLLSAPYPNGYRTEVNLAALDWLSTVADRLKQGYVLTIDYGYPAHRYYSPTRSQGTLQCYLQHAHHSDPYVAIGRQDITAHVNFTALEQYGAQYGLEPIGFTQQGLFLMALGLGDRIADLSTPNPDVPLQDLLSRRESLHALMNPMGLGNFGVLVQGKRLGETARSLQGLEVPE
jgi:SAM-dependent MidA family methyltransferase